MVERVHESYARFYLPRLRNWTAVQCGTVPQGSQEDDRITTLNLDNTHMSDDDCLALAQALQGNASLTLLSIANNANIGPAGICALATAVSTHPTLRTLRLTATSDSVPWMPRIHDDKSITQFEDLESWDAVGAAKVYQCIADAVAESRTLSEVELPAFAVQLIQAPCSDDPVDVFSFVGEDFSAFPHVVTVVSAMQSIRNSRVQIDQGALLNHDMIPPAWKACFTSVRDGVRSVDAAACDLRSSICTPPSLFAHGLSTIMTVVGNSMLRRLDVSDFGSRFADEGARFVSSALAQPTCALEDVRLAANDVSSEGATVILAALTSGSGSSLTELDLSSNRITDRAASAFLSSIRNRSCSLAYVHFDGNCISPVLAAQVSQSLAVNSQPARFREVLHELEHNASSATRAIFNHSGGARLNDVSCRLLMHALRVNSQIVHIDISGNNVSDEGASFLAEILCGNRSLKRLIARRNRITDVGALLIVAAIPRNPSIEEVDLDEQEVKVSDEVADRIRWLASLNHHPSEIKAKGLLILQNDPSLDSIRISESEGPRKLSNASVTVLCQMLGVNSNVQSLAIINHPTTDTLSWVSVLQSISTIVSHLTQLDVSANGLDDSHTASLCQMLTDTSQGSQLKSLCLARNGFSDTAASRFVEVIQRKNEVLTSLDLSDTPVTQAAQHEVEVAAKLNLFGSAFKKLIVGVMANDPSIANIDLHQVQKTTPLGTSYHFVPRYDDTAAEILAESLERNRSVTTLNLSGNRITDAGAEALATMLRTNTSVTALQLSHNLLTNTGVRALSRALLEAHHVRVLSLDGNSKVDDKATLRSIQLSLSQNCQASESDSGPSTSAVYNSALTQKRATLIRAAEQERELEAAILEDAMCDFHAARRRVQIEQTRKAERDREQHEAQLREQHGVSTADAAPESD